MWSKKNIAETIAAVLVFLFLYTSLSKYQEFHHFVRTLTKFPIIGSFAYLTALLLPGVEITVTVLLIIPKTRLRGFYSSLFLLTVFTLYFIYMVTFRSHLPCSCGGVISKLTWRQHIFFNLFFIVLSAIGIHLSKNNNRSNVLTPNHSPA